MVLGGNQPYFFPYIGYFQLINLVDVFVLSDDYQYIEGGWINRNKILQAGKPIFFNVEIEHVSSNKKINDLYISESFDVSKKLLQLKHAYNRAPYFRQGYHLIETLLLNDEKNLAKYLEYTIKGICNYLDITTRFILSSEIEHDCSKKKEERIFEQCNFVGADTYINAIGGMKLYSFEQFRNQNIKLGFIKTLNIEYKQLWYEFNSNLSIIDLIMFNSRETIKEMLGKYDIIWEDS